MDNGSEWTVHLWFKNFLFTYETEYVVCDWTCLIGEVGGNMGFFLGGSILAFIDIVMTPLRKKIVWIVKFFNGLVIKNWLEHFYCSS